MVNDGRNFNARRRKAFRLSQPEITIIHKLGPPFLEGIMLATTVYQICAWPSSHLSLDLWGLGDLAALLIFLLSKDPMSIMAIL